MENVPVTHPVYEYLLRAETRGFLPHYSLADLPLERRRIVSALKMIDERRSSLSNAESRTLDAFMEDFDILPGNNYVIIPSKTDSSQLIFGGLITDREKYIYHYQDSSSTAKLSPLASVEYRIKSSADGIAARNVALGNLGLRLFGTIDGKLGYYLEATNGRIIGGDRSLAREDPRLRQNVKFGILNDDFDFTHSHVRYRNDWFYASIGRERRVIGAGLNQHVLVSGHAPAFDALTIGASFSQFEYSYTHASLLALSESAWPSGFPADIPQKYAAFHRFAYKPSWGEIAFWESVVYTGRPPDLGYLNPLSFLKSVEHALHDRDNSIMGFDATIRPFAGLQIKGGFFLDDIIIENIGTGYWSNKTAWNIAFIGAIPASLPIDIGIEYTRVEPYTYSHFKYQESFTHDSSMIGSVIPPNSDQLSAMLRLWYGGRYPVTIEATYSRHGANIYDAEGNLVENVGGDPFQTRRPEDPMTVEFLDGRLSEVIRLGIEGGWEILRGYNLHLRTELLNVNGAAYFAGRILFRFGDF
ncbi:MAG: hypothetical protein ACLFQX_09290 [Candidatus Kapaibacterium sp.]